MLALLRDQKINGIPYKLLPLYSTLAKDIFTGKIGQMRGSSQTSLTSLVFVALSGTSSLLNLLRLAHLIATAWFRIVWITHTSKVMLMATD